MIKYSILNKILDEIRNEAPPQFKRYYPLPSDTDGINAANSRAYIHLFLKVKFGLLSFEDREVFITDDTNDGGVDGYFVDDENKIIYFIQSKFRTSAPNFESKSILLEEILNMELDRITKGERTSLAGIQYNGKIQKLINQIGSIPDYVKYTEKVILLANLNSKYYPQITKLTLFPTEVFDFERCYNELVFPVVSGTYFNAKELKITIKLNTNASVNRIYYPVDTKFKECNITVLFVPTLEIGKILFRFKNSILKFNPRSYLELSSGSVNRKIQGSILDISTNEFALYNNGITFLSDNTFYKDRVARKNEAEIVLTNPQIINGGQTAYTLSRIYEECLRNHSDLTVFEGKEVLIKIITFEEAQLLKIEEEQKLELIEAISKATNDQTAVTDADRRSNEMVQIQLQTYLFENYGFFYERKKGEFADGIRQKYIDRNQIIDREIFLRICLSINGNPSQARRASVKQLFEKDTVIDLLRHAASPKYFYGYRAFLYLGEIQKGFQGQKNNKFGQAQFGYALRYGKLAVTGVFSNLYQGQSISEIEIQKTVDELLEKWTKFEESVKLQDYNFAYFRKYLDEESQQDIIEVDFDNYYKGRTVSKDLVSFFQF